MENWRGIAAIFGISVTANNDITKNPKTNVNIMYSRKVTFSIFIQYWRSELKGHVKHLNSKLQFTYNINYIHSPHLISLRSNTFTTSLGITIGCRDRMSDEEARCHCNNKQSSPTNFLHEMSSRKVDSNSPWTNSHLFSFSSLSLTDKVGVSTFLNRNNRHV